jgi:hypothetical protein
MLFHRLKGTLMRILAFACVLLVLTACDDDSSVLVPPGKDDLGHARASWIALDHHDYQLTQERLCFCLLGGQPVRLTVRADTLLSGMLLADSSMLSAEQLQYYHGVEGLFEFAGGIIPSAVADFQLSFDSLYFFPSHVWVDYDRGIADEEMGYRSYDFAPL